MGKDSIYTIPINDVFLPRRGCPVCRLTEMLTQRCISYVLGSAMMEPDIRMETNRLGFCRDHLVKMHYEKNKLSLSLMLETHLEELYRTRIAMPLAKGKLPEGESCFVCNEVKTAADKILRTAVTLFVSDTGFRTIFEEQEYFCMPHHTALYNLAGETLPKKQLPSFQKTIAGITGRYLDSLQQEVHRFSLMFDYRSRYSEEEKEKARCALESALLFLSGREAIGLEKGTKNVRDV